MPSSRSPDDHLPRAPARRRVEAGRRLVEEQQLGVADQGKRDVQPPLLTARHPQYTRFGLLRQPHLLDRLIDVPRPRVVPGEQLERLAHRELGVHPALLQDDADALAPLAGRMRGVLAEDRDLARRALAIALEHLDRRGLAGAVRAQEGEDLAPLDGQVQATDGLEVAIGLAQARDADDRISHACQSNSTSRWTTRSTRSSRPTRCWATRSAIVTDRWRPPVQPIAIVRCDLPSATYAGSRKSISGRRRW